MTPRFTLALLALLLTALSAVAGPRAEQWKQVDEAIAAQLPKSAIAALEPIIAASIQDQAYAEAIKAVTRKIVLEAGIEGNGPEERITRLQAALPTVPVRMRSVMEAVLAHWYWQYFQQNRWRFIQRSQTAEPSGRDLKTWDLTRILAEIDRHFVAALADESALKATPISSFDEFLVKGNASDAYRPTLFDFLSYEALAFYQAGEHGNTAAEDAFELDANSPIFDDAGAFIAWTVWSPPDASPILKAIHIYQKLLSFHATDTDRSAYYDADLARLVYGLNTATDEGKAERYKGALNRFIDATSRHEVSARARARLGSLLWDDGDYTRAHAMARRGRGAFPESVGGKLCANLIEQIEAKSATIETEGVWNAPSPALAITYRNLTKVYFKAVAFDFDEYVRRSRWSYGGLVEELRNEILGGTPKLEWSEDLQATPDYKPRTVALTAPKSLRPGFYFIVASHERAFGADDNHVSTVPVWVSDLALVIRSHEESGENTGFVLKAESGEPVASARIRTWKSNREGQFEPGLPTQTDSNGRFRLPVSSQPVIVMAEAKGQAVASEHPLYSPRTFERAPPTTKTVFFTDRALYRPGQTVQYKGIVLRNDQVAAKYNVVPATPVTVLFLDPNGKEIARARHQTNEYGSFGGVFTAPRDRAMGRMVLRTTDQNGDTSFNVEEYKRPKFQVELSAPKEAAKLTADVTVTGKAAAYTGAAIGGAKVKWRVERAVRLPRWCWWWQPPATKAIAHGSAVTDAEGAFAITFTAAPDRDVPIKNEPVFAFSVHADVTDTTGETRSDDQTVSVGYTALQATLTTGEWQVPDKPVEFEIAITSLDGVPQSAAGSLLVQALQQPAKVKRTSLRDVQYGGRNIETPAVDPANPESWIVGKSVGAQKFTTNHSGKTQIALSLKEGIYRVSLETKDHFGNVVTARHTFQVLDPRDERYPVKVPQHVAAPKWSLEPGEKFTALWGTGYATGRAYIELECDGKSLQSGWTTPNRTQIMFGLPVTEEMRGGFTVRVTYVRENRAYVSQRIVEVPWTNKSLTVKWETFRSKLMPGQKETWTATVSGADAKRVVAEVVATLYDGSLDQYLPHLWPGGFGVFRNEFSRTQTHLHNSQKTFRHVIGDWEVTQYDPTWTYRTFPSFAMARDQFDNGTVMLSAFSVATRGRSENLKSMSASGGIVMAAEMTPNPGASAVGDVTAKPTIDLSKVTARKNLNETAFFFPQLLSDKDGLVKLQFSMPEALTEWKLLAFAHDKQLRSGLLTDKAVTAKDLMVEPNPPRFVREGDVIEFAVKVSNQTDQPQTGKVKLTFSDVESQKPVNGLVGNLTEEKPFELAARQSRTLTWPISVPSGLGFLAYKAVGGTASVSDGEEGFLPVLSRQILVAESLPLPIRGKTTRNFEFKKLLESAGSGTLQSQSLTVQMVSQPAWYAVLALPYLIEYPYDCSEQVFNRYYANTLARHIADSDPKIRRIFDLWRGTGSLNSPLEKNQDLKSIAVEETPWLRQAKTESEARRKVGVLFDHNRLEEESRRALQTLAERQLADGGWSWFPSGRESDFISLYIVAGFGRLQYLGVEIDPSLAMKALGGLDAAMDRAYKEIKDRESYVPSGTDALYLYARSFFTAKRPVAKEHVEAVKFFLAQARSHWTQLSSRQNQAHLALALHRFGDKETPAAILKSLKERSVTTEELGMSWRDSNHRWLWQNAAIETQAMMIEAFAEITEDAQAVEDCKAWLLKQKQTQDWKTTKATADAAYALLLRGKNLLTSNALVEVTLGGETIKPESVEAGTGFYEKQFIRDEIKPAMGMITVKKVDDGISWGSVHWQYLEDVGKVTPHTDTPLTLKKMLFVRETTSQGQVLRPVAGPLAVGDELVVRLVLRTDRDMEYLHLKDQRGSGTEPVNVLSRYRYQDGLGYYETTRDTASHFFIDRLPSGTYVFEYSTRVQLKGRYQTGIAEIQCMYAPEFNSHSGSIPLEVN